MVVVREIKFRAWSLGKMLSHEQLRKYEDDEPGVLFNMFDSSYEGTHIMQYTGLKDKNGVEIYEGDVADIRYEDGGHTKDMFTPCVCTYKTIDLSSDWGEEFTPGFEFVQYSGPNSFAFDNLYGGHVEVIGNIYQNPELLKEAS